MEENTIKDPRETGVQGMSGIPSLSEQAQRMANSLMGTSPSQYKIENLQSLANMPAIEEIGNVLPNFSKYDESIHTNEELANYQQHRAQEQPWTLKAVNSLVSGAVSGLATALEDIGYILDIEGHFNSWENLDNAKDNWLSAAMRDAKEDLYNALPIYETESDTALGQFFKFSTLRGMLDSMIGFAIPGGAVAKGIGIAAKASRIGNLTNKLLTATNAAAGTKVLSNTLGSIAKSVTAGAITNYAEGQMMAIELGENAKQQYIESKAQDYYNKYKDSITPITLDEAYQLANDDFNKDLDAQAAIGKQQAAFVDNNRLFMLTDAIGLHGLIKTKNAFRQALLTNPKEKYKALKNLTKLNAENPLLQSLKEGSEEIGQNILQKEGEYQIRKATDTLTEEDKELGDSFWDRALAFGTSKQAIVEGLMGAVTGPGQRMIARATTDILSGDIFGRNRREREFQEYTKQQNFINTINNKVANIIKAEALKAEAISQGDDVTADAIWNKEATDLISTAIQNDTIEALDRSTQDIINNPNISYEEKQQANKFQKLINDLENEYIIASHNPNSTEIFNNRAQHRILQTWAKDLQAEIQDKVAKVNDSLNTKSATYSIHLDKNFNIEESTINDEIAKESPQAYQELVTSIKKYSDIKKALNQIDKEYKDITNKEYQKQWVHSEAEKIIKQQKEQEKQAILQLVDKPLIALDKNNKPIESSRAKIVKDNNNYYLRQYDDELNSYSIPYLFDTNGQERPVTSQDLQSFKVESNNDINDESLANTNDSSEVKFFTPEEIQTLTAESNQINNLEDLDVWKESKTYKTKLSEEAIDEINRLYDKAKTRIIQTDNSETNTIEEENPDVETIEYDRIDDYSPIEVENSLWDPPMRSAENWWRGTKGSEIASRTANQADQIRWYDFLDQHDARQFSGIIMPFEYDGKLAGRFVLTNNKGEFIDQDGNAIGKVFDINRCIYTTVADPSTDATGKYFGTKQSFDQYKNDYLQHVWKHLQEGKSVPVRIRQVSSGIIDSKHKKDITKANKDLVPLEQSLPDNMKLSDLTIYVSTNGQIITEDGTTFAIKAGTTAIENKANGHFYRANSTPIQAKEKELIINLFKYYINKSIELGYNNSAKLQLKTSDGLVTINFFSLLRDILRYNSTGNPARSLYNIKNDKGNITSKWSINDTIIDTVTTNADGELVLNEAFIQQLDKFLNNAFYNIRASKMNPKSTEPYYFPTSINKDGTLAAQKYSNYHEFAKRKLVDFVEVNSPYAHAERYVIFEPLEINTVPDINSTVISSNKAESVPTTFSDIKKQILSGTPVRFKMTFITPATGNSNERIFDLSYNKGKINSSLSDDLFSINAATQFTRVSTLEDWATNTQMSIALSLQQLGAISPSMDVDQFAEKLNVKIAVETNNSDISVLSKLQEAIDKETNPIKKAALEKALETAKTLDNTKPKKVVIPTTTKFRRTYESLQNNSNIELQKAVKWFQQKFPDIDIKIVERAIKQNIVGKFEDGVITIYQGTSNKTVYHEAFHVIINCLLSASEKNNLIQVALSNNQYTEQFKQNKTLYPNATDEELAEEVLAEVFADYMVLENEPNSILNKIFNWLKTQITKLYNSIIKNGKVNRDWTQSIESIITHVKNTNFLTRDYLTLKADKIHNRVIPGLDEITTADAVNSLHYWFLQTFKSDANLMEILQSDNGKLVATAYQNAYAQFQNQLELTLNELTTTTSDNTDNLLERISKLQLILDTWNDPNGVRALHQKERLAQYRLELNTSENYQNSNAEISGGESNQGRDAAALFAESITISSKINSNKIIKLLLSTIPKKTYNFKTREAIPYLNSLGMPEVEPFGKVFNILANKLANLPTNISAHELLTMLTEVAEEYPAIYTLIRDEQVTVQNADGTLETVVIPSWLKLDKVDQWTNADALQVIQFLQSFNNNRNNYLIGITKPNGQYITFNASIIGQRAKISSSWRAQLTKDLLSGNKDVLQFYTKQNKQGWKYNTAEFKKAFPKLPDASNILFFLHVLGINFDINNPATLDKAIKTKAVLSKVATLWYQITTGKLTNPVVFESDEDKRENLDELINVQVELGIDTLENSHISLDNERIYDLQKPGYINQVVNKFNRVSQNPNRLYTELIHLDPSKNVYVTHSILLNRLLSNQKPQLKVYIHEGNRESSYNSSVAYKDLKLIDKLASVLNLTMEGKDNVMRPADNGQERFLDHENLWVDNNTSRQEIIDIFKGYLWDEIARSHIKDRAFTNLNKNYNKGPLIESLLTKEEQTQLVDTTETPEQFANRIINSISNDVWNTRIENLINTWATNIFNKLKDLGGILERTDGTVVNNALKLSTNPTTTIYPTGQVKEWLRLAVINYAIGNIEQSKILYGDNIFYKSLGDEFKRHNGAMGSKKTCLTGNMINTAIKKGFKRMDGAEGLVDINGQPIMRTAIFADVPSYSEQLYYIAEIVDQNNPKYQNLKKQVLQDYERSTKEVSFEDLMIQALIKNADKLGLNSAPYADMTEGDGFGIISLDAYREFKIRVGDWNGDSEKLYQWEVQERMGVPKKERVYTDLNGKTLPLKYGDWGIQVFNSLKPQHFGPLANVEGYKPSFYKLSLMPLIPSVITALGHTNLQNMHELMIKNQIGVVVHSSANKGVTTKTNFIVNNAGVKVTNTDHPFNDFYDQNGNFLIDEKGDYKGPVNLLTQDTYWEYWGIQVDTGEHKHHDVVTGTQMMVQILNGLFDAGKISEHFKEDIPVVEERVNEYINLNNERIHIGRDLLIKQLGLIAQEQGWKISSEGITDLVNSLRIEAIERGLADNYIHAIELLSQLSDGTTNVDILPTREKIENILMSKAASMTTSQKRHGTAAFQVPSTMWEMSTSRTYNEGKYKSSDLKFVVHNVDGKPKITSMEVYLPSPFKGIVNVNQVPKELLQLIGFRIPTQGLSSIETIIVKDFLPEEAGDIIVLPTEIVAKAGSD